MATKNPKRRPIMLTKEIADIVDSMMPDYPHCPNRTQCTYQIIRESKELQDMVKSMFGDDPMAPNPKQYIANLMRMIDRSELIPLDIYMNELKFRLSFAEQQAIEKASQELNLSKKDVVIHLRFELTDKNSKIFFAYENKAIDSFIDAVEIPVVNGTEELVARYLNSFNVPNTTNRINTPKMEDA